MATSSVCGCFGNLRTRYKRLVDNVFPSDPSQGLVKANMEKLTFYALQAPEKLDRIGDYMFMKINNHLYRKKLGFVYIAMEAMDRLLLACRSSSLNLFVESFLKIVSALLESHEIGLQICATNSFVKFANIDEDTPSYHRRYEFFISRFSQLCYGSNDDSDTEKSIRLSGLQGLQGVVRKTMNDDLQANIWEDVHMSKIVPALLFNIESNTEVLISKSSASMSQVESPDDQNEDPAHLADLCLRELVTRAGFNNIAAILYPLLTFMDSRSLWLKNEFPLHIFKIIMYSIQNQYSYRAIELLLSHLDKHKNSEAEMRASVVEMISASVSIATGGSIGPSILEVFNTLLKHLKISVDTMGIQTSKSLEGHSEGGVQKAIINAAGAFSSILADYQRVDVMLFIITKVPNLNNVTEKKNDNESRDSLEELLHVNLLKCLLQVAKSHHTKQFSSTFSQKLLDALLTGLQLNSPDVRFYIQKLLIVLLDRHSNADVLSNLSEHLTTGELNFTVEKCSRQDLLFIRKNSQYFLFNLYESCCIHSNKPRHYNLLTNIVCLLVLEFGQEDYLVELVAFVLGIQNLISSKDCKLTFKQRSCLHAFVLVFFLMVSDLITIPSLLQHCETIISARQNKARWFLPSVAFTDEEDLMINHDDIPLKEVSFDANEIVEALKNRGYDTKAIETPYEPKPAVRTTSTVSIPEHLPIAKADSMVSLGSSVYRMEAPVPKITYEDLKDVLRNEGKTEKDGVLSFETASFQQIVAHNEKLVQDMDNKLKRSLEVSYRATQTQRNPETDMDLFEIEFPSLLVY
ncbi:protein EFR3 homolog B-like [Clytia hemisphaerica]|uniref:Uncharacterized protein n=1 Tax=Clytia hemisphaerica TaxID=252671 RepID=A0A7M5UUY3_9CNID